MVAAAALSVTAGAVPAPAAGGYTVTATIPVGSDPYGVAVDPAAGTVYVANGGGTVSVIDAATRLVTATIPVGSDPYGVAVDPAARTAYAANYLAGTVSVIGPGTPDLAITLTNARPFRPWWTNAYQVTVTNTGTAAEPRATVRVHLDRGLWPVHAGGSRWTCRASLSRSTETCAGTTPLPPGHATTFLVQAVVLARPGTTLTSTADVTPADATPADNHARDTARVQPWTP